MRPMEERVMRAIRGVWQKNVPEERICELAAYAAIEALREPLWEALKARCCSDPAEAKRIVMLSRHDFNAALSEVTE